MICLELQRFGCQCLPASTGLRCHADREVFEIERLQWQHVSTLRGMGPAIRDNLHHRTLGRFATKPPQRTDQQDIDKRKDRQYADRRLRALGVKQKRAERPAGLLDSVRQKAAGK